MLIAVDAPHFYAGIIIENDYCIKAAPILKWCVGKHKDYLYNYFCKKGWKSSAI